MSDFRPGVMIWQDDMEARGRRDLGLPAQGLVFRYPGVLGKPQPAPRPRRGWLARWWANWRGVETVDAGAPRP